jgi:hypothetical protein
LRVYVPLIVFPLAKIDLTWPASTCRRNVGLNGTFARVGPDCTISSDSQLIASSTPKKIQNPRHRCGGRGLCSSGIPRPSGAGATRHRPRSCGIGAVGTASFVSGATSAI